MAPLAKRPLPRSILAMAFVLAFAACATPLSDRPGYDQAIACDGVAPLHARLTSAVTAGDLDNRLDEVAALNSRYRAVCVDGQSLPGQAAALLDDISLILQEASQ